MNHTLHWRGICVFVRCEEAKRIALYRRNAGSNGIARQFHKQKSFHKRRTHRIKRVRQRAHDHTFVLCFRQGTLCTSYMYIVQPHVINAFFCVFVVVPRVFRLCSLNCSGARTVTVSLVVVVVSTSSRFIYFT